jgi:hypothetical protein
MLPRKAKGLWSRNPLEARHLQVVLARLKWVGEFKVLETSVELDLPGIVPAIAGRT